MDKLLLRKSEEFFDCSFGDFLGFGDVILNQK